MIEIQAKIHDKFSVEFKTGYSISDDSKVNTFALNAWFFVPGSLDVNPSTYSKEQFYIDVKSNVRLITPVFLMREIASGSSIPLNNLTAVIHKVASNPTPAIVSEYEYNIKMFSVIVKSSLRDEIAHICKNVSAEDLDYAVKAYLENVTKIADEYRKLRPVINVPIVPQKAQNYYGFGDEYISNMIEHYTFQLIAFLEQYDAYKALNSSLKEMLKNERLYRIKRNYQVVEPSDPKLNRDLVFRSGLLKKYVDSDLYLDTNTKKDGRFAEQLYFSLAAGISMIFATVIAFTAQQKYGSFTLSLFVVLVLSYMLKDRIKDMMRYYFAHKLKGKYFDHKTTIGIHDNPIGWIKEGVDFIPETQVPQEVLAIRDRSPLLEAENRTTDEKILLFRKQVMLDRDTIDTYSKYTLRGINDITRIYLNQFAYKTDSPEVSLRVITDEDKVSVIFGKKIYYLNIIMQLNYDSKVEYKRYRVVFNRHGIVDLEKF